MMGAIIGDIVGSRFEFDNHKSKDFELFDVNCEFTDDTAMTVAIAKAILTCIGERLPKYAQLYMRRIGQKYPYLSYGMSFMRWLFDPTPRPYNSFGNGAAMRVSPVAWAARDLKSCKRMSDAVTMVTHNHPEGMKGAAAVADAIYLARRHMDKDQIRAHVEFYYCYDLSFTLDEIRDSYTFNETCQGTVPQAIVAFLESEDFEDAIRNAVSIGGDSDTIAAITGAIAEAYYGIPQELVDKARSYLPDEFLSIIDEFESIYPVERLDKRINRSV